MKAMFATQEHSNTTTLKLHEFVTPSGSAAVQTTAFVPTV
jgi:hypothetical protein